MKYKRRNDVFTISAILDQIGEYLEDNKKLPKVLFLPVEEYIYYPYLVDMNRLVSGCKELIGIPIKVYFEKQDKHFAY